MQGSPSFGVSLLFFCTLLRKAPDMCGRSSLTKTEKELEARFQATFYSEDLERYNPLPNFNVAPTQMHPVITNLDPKHLQFFKWGLIPFWAKDIKIGYKMINARKETLLEKSTFKNAVKKKRCIVPFDGFYEWKKIGNKKIPFRIGIKDEEIFCIAGLWERWNNPEGGEIYSFTLITQEPNEFMSKIHNRMPAILDRDQEKYWLDDDIPVEDLINSLNPPPDENMIAYTVDARVGNVRNNDAELIKKVVYPELSL
jgi:putative SOS response-associated peptidase YedK